MISMHTLCFVISLILHVSSHVRFFSIFDIDINEKNRNDGISPLHEAAKYNSVDVGRLLIESGCDVMIRDNHKKTPLHHAARRGREKIAEVKLPK